MIHSKNIYSL